MEGPLAQLIQIELHVTKKCSHSCLWGIIWCSRDEFSFVKCITQTLLLTFMVRPNNYMLCRLRLLKPYHYEAKKFLKLLWIDYKG